MAAFVLRMAGLRDVVARLGHMLGTKNFSSLSRALARETSLRFVRGLVERIESRHKPKADELVILDGMPLTLPATQRHRMPRYNGKTVGGGVIWAFMVNAARGTCPVRVLKVIAGAWNDAGMMHDVELTAHGPVYVMDRGFFSLFLFSRWLGQGVRFIVRARRNAIHEIIRTVSKKRKYGAGHIELDAVVRLGFERAKLHPHVRMIRAEIGKMTLIVVTSEMEWSAERILDAYKQRGKIEQFHRCLKEVIGLAHLYSFSQNGATFLLYTVMLLAILLVMSEKPKGREVLAVLRAALKTLRTSLGLAGTWKRNTNALKRAKGVK